MDWDTPPPPQHLEENEKCPAKGQKEQPLGEAETWAHRCPKSKGRERLDSDHPSFISQAKPWLA